MDTDHLRLLHITGEAEPGDYVDWACTQLCAGVDSRGLRILAGLNPLLDSKAIRNYFKLTCHQLGLNFFDQVQGTEILAIRSAYENGQFDARKAIGMLGGLYQHGIKELRVFILILRELADMSLGGGEAYPRKYLDNLDRTFQTEWELLLRAKELALPDGYLGLRFCMNCGQAGETFYLETAVEIFGMTFAEQTRDYCKMCGSGELEWMIEPEVRKRYFSKFVKTQKAASPSLIIHRGAMSLQHDVEEIFEGKAFMRPLFYSYPGGLRFELSEGGSAIEQFLCALRKARLICEDIFDTEGSLVVCLRSFAQDKHCWHREVLTELRAAGIKIPSSRCIWSDSVPKDDRIEEDCEERWVNVAFQTPVSLLQNYLWCALSTDFGVIKPNPGCCIYLFNLDRRVMVFPYDDRGMDVVGPNHAFLSDLYRKHSERLLSHDLATMKETFEPS